MIVIYLVHYQVYPYLVLLNTTHTYIVRNQRKRHQSTMSRTCPIKNNSSLLYYPNVVLKYIYRHFHVPIPRTIRCAIVPISLNLLVK